MIVNNLILLSIFIIKFKFAISDNCPDDFEQNILLKESNLSKIKCLISKGANVNYQSPDGLTPLIISVKMGNYKVASTLLEAGADVSFTKDGQTALIG